MSDALDRLSRDRVQNRVRSQRENEESFRRGGNAILAGAAGAVDEALFGLGEAGFRAALGDEAVDNWIKEHGEDAFRVGEMIGTIGGSFIPVGGIVGRGLSKLGRGIQGARTAGNLARVGGALQGAGRFMQGTSPAARSLLGRIGQAGVRGGIEGALESGIRAATNRRDVLSETGAGALFGFGGGALGGALGEAGKSLAELRKKTTRPAFLANAGIDQRSIRQGFEQGQIGGQAYRAGNVDPYLDDFVDYMKRNRIRNAEELDDFVSANRKRIGSQFEVFNKLDVPTPTLTDLQRRFVNDKSLYNEMVQIGVPDMRRAMNEVTERISAAGKPTNQLGAAEKIMQQNRPGIPGRTNYQEAQFIAARAMKDQIQESLSNAAQKAGLKGYGELGKEWNFNELLGRASKKGDLSIPSSGTGSGTFDKTALYSLLSGGGLGALTGVKDFDNEDVLGSLGKIGLSSLGGAAIAGGLGAGRNFAMSKLDDLLLAASKNKRLARVLGGDPTNRNLLKQIGVRTATDALGRGGASIDATARQNQVEDQLQRDRESLAPSEPEQADQIGEAAADAQQTPEGRAEYNSLVQQKLYQRFVEMYPLYAEDDEAFRQFVAGAERASEGFDPRRTAKLLFPREDDRKAFLAAYQTQQTVGQTIPNIGVENKGGLFGFGATPLTLEQQGARATLEGAFLEASKLANIEPRDARKILEQVLDSNLSAAEKRQAILNQTRAWNQIGFEKLQAVGLG